MKKVKDVLLAKITVTIRFIIMIIVFTILCGLYLISDNDQKLFGFCFLTLSQLGLWFVMAEVIQAIYKRLNVLEKKGE